MRDTVVIHCADTPNGSSSFTILDIDEWHRERGFLRNPFSREIHMPHLRSVGYQKVIHVDGGVADGRAESEKGAHAGLSSLKNANERSLGVCLIGTDKFTVPQWWALRSVVMDWVNRYDIQSVVGHRDIDTQGKTCPGFDVQEWLDGDMKPIGNHIVEK